MSAKTAGDRAPVTAQRRVALVGSVLPAVLVGVGLCWWLASPAGPADSAAFSGVALAAAVMVLGLGGLPLLGVQPDARLIVGLGAVWLVFDVLALWFDVAQRSGTGVLAVDVSSFLTGAASSSGELIAAGTAVVALGWAGWAVIAGVDLDGGPTSGALAALAGLGIGAVAVTGHAASHAFEPIVVVAHALSAAWWCGTLAAMAVSINSRNGWRAALPRFSRYAMLAVIVIAASGAVAGVLELGFSAQWWTTGYGRIMVAKIVGLVGLIAIAATQRRRWVPAAQARRTAAEASLRHAVVELLPMMIVLGLAVGLSSTNPG